MKTLIFLSCLLGLGLAALSQADAQVVVNITVADSNASEGGNNTAAFQISRDVAVASDLPINLAVVAGLTDAQDSDFTLSPLLSNVVIPSGAQSVTVTVTAVDDNAAEAEENLTLEIAPSPGYAVGVNNMGTITIDANDFEVTSLKDFDPLGNATALEREGTLRQAVENAHDFGADATITFSDSVFSGDQQVIALTEEIVIFDAMTIHGPGADHLALDGGETSRIFWFDDSQDSFTATVSGLTFLGGIANSTGPEGSRGGAIFGGGGGGLELTLTENSFTGNTGGDGGALAFNSDDGKLLVERCLFEGNRALSEGGAIAFISGLEVRITDSTFARNSSTGRAGALVFGGGTSSPPELINLTIVGNQADEDDGGQPGDFGGGLFLTPGVPCILNNTIVAGNLRGSSTPLPDDIGGDVTPAVSGHNLIGDPATSGGLADNNRGNIVGLMGEVLPIDRIVETERFDRILPLVIDNGGATRSVRLFRSSPAIGNGDGLLISSSGFDQRGFGFPREVAAFPQFGSIGNVDIGAVEFDPILVTTEIDEDDGTVDPAFGSGTSLREAIAKSNRHYGSDLIVFSRGLDGSVDFFGGVHTIEFSDEIVVEAGVEIDGPGAELLELRGDFDQSGEPSADDTRLFTFAGRPPDQVAPPNCALRGLTLANGSAWVGDQIQDGGAIFNDGATLFVQDSVFRRNAGVNGGAIFNRGTLSLFRVALENNDAQQGGGAVFTTLSAEGGFLSAQRCTFFDNSANEGGALLIDNGTVRLSNSTLSSNAALVGGGISFRNGQVRITNSTIAQNIGGDPDAGGGIEFSGAATGALLELDNSIVAANTAGSAAAQPSDIIGGAIAAGSLHNLISSAATSGGLSDGVDGNIVGEGGSGSIPFDAVLEPLGDNGGLTQTYLLAAGSPAIDNGDNASAAFITGTPLTTDQRDLPRITNSIVDIGSVEVQGLAPVLDPLGDFFVNELEPLNFTATAFVPGGGSPAFSLEDGQGFVPGNAFIDPDTGEFSWIPDEVDGPGFFVFDVVVARDDDPDSTDFETITIDVFELNENPTLDPIGDQTVAEGSQLAFTATASDIDDPENAIIFSLDGASEAFGMVINPNTGEFNWTPGIGVMTGDFTVTISIEDDGDPTLGDSRTFDITVTDVSQPIVSLAGITGAEAHEPGSFSNAPNLPLESTFELNRDSAGGDLVVRLQIDNSSQATHGTDFQISVLPGGAPVSFSGDPPVADVTIPSGETIIGFVLSAIDDEAAEASESIDLSILPAAGFGVGNGNLTQVIAQNDFGVTNLGDFDPTSEPVGGGGTLRQAIINAKSNLSLPGVTGVVLPEITFSDGLVGDLALTEGPLLLDTRDFSIIGPGSDLLTVHGDGSSRVFIAYDTNGNRNYSISGLRVNGGTTDRNGGGIFSSEVLALSDCVISGCSADNGGGISNEGDLVMDRCVLISNDAVVFGGGLDNFGGFAVLRECAIIDNMSAFGGGIENSSMGNLNVEASTVAGNSAFSSGGGIDSFSATTSISNSTVSGNDAGFGAGVFNEMSGVTILQSTIVGNIATSSVGGVLTSSNAPPDAPPGNSLLHNTIVAGNTEGSQVPADIATENATFGDVDPASSNNLIGDASSSGGLIDGVSGNKVGLDGVGTRPVAGIVAILADNGGSTATHALVPGSPAIDAGDNSFALDPFGAALTSDQRGAAFLRIVDGTVDIGAFEVNPEMLEILACELSAGPEMSVTWRSVEGGSYDVLRSTDLRNWQPIAAVVATSDTSTWTDSEPPTLSAYYIVRERAPE